MRTAFPPHPAGARGRVLLGRLLLAPTVASVALAGGGDGPLDLREVAPGAVRGTFTSHVGLSTRGATSQRDVVLYLRGSQSVGYALPEEPVVVTQHKLQFLPHVLPVLKGTPVRFTNEDDVDHAVLSTDACCAVDLAIPPHSEVPVTFDQEGVASVVCRRHPEMSLWIVVLGDPWFTHVQLEKERQEDDADAAYTSEYAIEGVPPGSYTLAFWNKKLTPREYAVTVRSGEVTRLDLLIEQ